MREVTVTEVAEALDAAVRLKGEGFVYSRPGESSVCRYMHGTKPGCLIGHVLIRLGALPEELAVQECIPADLLNYNRLGLNIPANAIRALKEAQLQQDEGETWGKARQAFRDALSRPSAPSNA
jgi:hypothetical protein